jgi:hypothetical protein
MLSNGGPPAFAGGQAEATGERKVLTGKLSRGRVNSITGAVGVAAGLGDALTGPPVVTLSAVRG